MNKIANWFHTLQKKLFSECSPAKWVYFLLIAFFTLFALWGLLIFWLDPYICFHKAFLVKQTYSDSYATIPGMLRHFPFDCVLIGSSMCKNFRISEINKEFDVSALKATSAGQTGDDAGRIIRLLTTEKRDSLKRIILGYDTWCYSKGANSGNWRSRPYLYDRKISWEYFFSLDSMEAALNVIVTNCAPANTKGANLEKNFDMMFADKLWRFRFSKEEMETAIRMERIEPAAVRDDTINLTKEYVFHPLEKCPEIAVDIFLPPYSVYFWTAIADQGKLEGYLKVREALAEEAARCPNIRLHDFQAETEIICDLENYKDLNHYSPKINTLILKGIRENKYAADTEKVRKANQRLRQLAREWNGRYLRLISGRKEK